MISFNLQCFWARLHHPTATTFPPSLKLAQELIKNRSYFPCVWGRCPSCSWNCFCLTLSKPCQDRGPGGALSFFFEFGRSTPPRTRVEDSSSGVRWYEFSTAAGLAAVTRCGWCALSRTAPITLARFVGVMAWATCYGQVGKFSGPVEKFSEMGKICLWKIDVQKVMRGIFFFIKFIELCMYVFYTYNVVYTR